VPTSEGEVLVDVPLAIERVDHRAADARGLKRERDPADAAAPLDALLLMRRARLVILPAQVPRARPGEGVDDAEQRVMGRVDGCATVDQIAARAVGAQGPGVVGLRGADLVDLGGVVSEHEHLQAVEALQGALARASGEEFIVHAGIVAEALEAAARGARVGRGRVVEAVEHQGRARLETDEEPVVRQVGRLPDAPDEGTGVERGVGEQHPPGELSVTERARRDQPRAAGSQAHEDLITMPRHRFQRGLARYVPT
jgi:hypothetical protein